MINNLISNNKLSKKHLVIFIIIVYSTSLFNYNSIVSFETYSDSLVWGKIISKKINPNDSNFGLHSVTYNDGESIKIILNKDPETNFYLNNYENIDKSKYEFGVYKSQYGIQGFFYSYLYENMVKRIEKLFNQDFRFSIFVLKFFQVIILSFILLLICLNVKKLKGNLFFFIYLLSFLLSPWIIKFASNLYFFTPFLFLPMLISLMALNKIERFYYFLPLYFLAILIKALSGYEFISTIMLSGIIFPVISLIENNHNRDSLIKLIFFSSIFMFLGFVIAIILHSGIRGEDIFSGFESIFNEDILRRTWPVNSDNDGNLISTILRYFSIGWLHDNLFVGINGILFFPIIFFLTLYFVLKNNNDFLKFIAFLSLPFSWFILAKNHSFIHYHINTVLWYFGFIQFCLFIIFKKIIENKNYLISIWKKL